MGYDTLEERIVAEVVDDCCYHLVLIGEFLDIDVFSLFVVAETDLDILLYAEEVQDSVFETSLIRALYREYPESPRIITSSGLPFPEGISDPIFDGGSTFPMPAATFSGDSGFCPVSIKYMVAMIEYSSDR